MLEDIQHGPFKARITFDHVSGTFECKYGNERCASLKLPEVRAWARARLRALSSLNWLPVMVVNYDVKDDRVNELVNSSNIALYIERCYIAWDSQKWVSCPWVVLPGGTYLVACHMNNSELDQKNYPLDPNELMQQRIAQSREFYAAKGMGQEIKWPIVEEESLNHQRCWVPLTEERWATLLSLLDKIRELRARIQLLLSHEKGWKMLQTMTGNNLLPPAQDS